MNFCRICNTELNDDNFTISRLKSKHYICNDCEKDEKHKWYINNRDKVLKRVKKYQHDHYVLKSSRNKDCSWFLGVHVAERVLSHTFKNVQRMPYNNPGYDFICGRGFKVDVKSSIRHKTDIYSDRWNFTIKKNKIADYFLCIAFDNRDDLNPEYIWLIPGCDINDKTGISIGETTLNKLDEYKINNINEIISCCDTIKSKLLNRNT